MNQEIANKEITVKLSQFLLSLVLLIFLIASVWLVGKIIITYFDKKVYNYWNVSFYDVCRKYDGYGEFKLLPDGRQKFECIFGEKVEGNKLL